MMLSLTVLTLLIPSASKAGGTTFWDWGPITRDNMHKAPVAVAYMAPLLVGILTIAAEEEFVEQKVSIEAWGNPGFQQRMQAGIRSLDFNDRLLSVYAGFGPNKAAQTSGWFGATMGTVLDNHVLNLVELGCAIGLKQIHAHGDEKVYEPRYEIMVGRIPRCCDPLWVPSLRLGWNIQRGETVGAISYNFF
ncbi:MAG: hypothetical protein COU73_04380 [Parcubacteria group bacterium CG10_big_fil_rev_8_21_14_0_10_46_32]|nr:MAG: hypothetical protein COU73_04380 [Parcubacteria group bacterium CG10_big_fil_rev_8_21_14_0_10_46_32]